MTGMCYLTFGNLIKNKLPKDQRLFLKLTDMLNKLETDPMNTEELSKLYRADNEFLVSEIDFLKQRHKFYEYQYYENSPNSKSNSKVEASQPSPRPQNKKTDKNNAKPAPKKQSEVKEQKPVDLSRLDIKVGKIMEVEKHPDADKLYVEKVDFGDNVLKTVISGLVNHVPVDKMKDRIALFVTNMKPVKMRGIASEGMILCASTPEKVEILNVPVCCKIGDRVSVEGLFGATDTLLNPKEKVIESVLPNLKVDANGVATYNGKPLISNAVGFQGVFKSDTLIDCPIK